jgi:hypothetical protein
MKISNMSNSKLFKVGGVSKINGQFKVRFTHDLMYVKGLTKAGNTEIELIEAPHEMTKTEMVAFLKTTELYNRAEYREAIDGRAEMYDPVTDQVKVARVAKVRVAKVSKQVLAGPVLSNKLPRGPVLAPVTQANLEEIRARSAQAVMDKIVATLSESEAV